VLISGIRRQIETRPQTELDRQARLKNPRQSFSITRDLTGYRHAVVDDVITTGATVNALAEALKGKGATSVVAWSVARGIGGAQQTGYSTLKI
jgi:predicted amidophosphoribosyltransferase